MKYSKSISVLFTAFTLIGFFSPSAFARQYNPSTGRFTKRDPIQYAENVGKNQVDLYTYATRPQGVRPQPSLYSPSLLVPDVEGFIMREPIGYEDGINMYSYVRNNPVNLTDANGKCGWICVIVVAGVATGAIAAGNIVCGFIASSARQDIENEKAARILNPHRCPKKPCSDNMIKALEICDWVPGVDTTSLIQECKSLGQ